jgi:ferric-dicitrate binding protein FerR (iron transport regulator)
VSSGYDDLDADILAYLAHDLDPARLDGLDRHLRDDATAAARFALLCRHELALTAALLQRPTARHPAARPRPPRSRRLTAGAGRWPWLVAAMLVAAITAGMAILGGRPASGPDEPGVATITEATGRSTISGHGANTDASPGMSLRAGARLAVGADARLLVTYADGSRLALDPDSRVALLTDGGPLVVLERGGIEAAISPQPAGRPFRLTTPQGQVEVVGTRFRLRVAGAITRLEVSDGKVRLSRSDDHATVLVQAGFACAAAGAAQPLTVQWIDRLAQRLPQGTRILLQADLSTWAGDQAAPPGFAGLAALGSHLPQPGTRFMGEVRSPLLGAGLASGPDRYLCLRYLSTGFRTGDRVKIMLKDDLGTIFHGEIRATGGAWADATVRLDGAFVDLDHAANPMPTGTRIAQIVLLAAAPDGQPGIAGPRLWLGDLVVCSGAPPMEVLEMLEVHRP